jgi:hypothetical protein
MNQSNSNNAPAHPPTTPTTAATQPRSGADRSGRLSTILTAALCTLLGVNLLVMAFGRSGPSSATAQVSGYTNGGLANAIPPTGVMPAPENIPSAPTTSVEMLKRVIEQQIETNARLGRIEASLAGPHPVTVTNWPAAPAK